MRRQLELVDATEKQLTGWVPCSSTQLRGSAQLQDLRDSCGSLASCVRAVTAHATDLPQTAPATGRALGLVRQLPALTKLELEAKAY
jgi:hypothetical protein